MKAARTHSAGRRGSRRQPELSRQTILQAALVEFSQNGLAGARMDAIAAAAGVNKALLYYYFRDKDALYGAVLDSFFAPLCQRIMAVCELPGSAGERFLAYAKEHFDSIAKSPHYPRIFIGELMTAGRGGYSHFDRIVENYMMPIGLRVRALVQEGIDSGEFRAVDASHFVPSAIGSIVHYFLTAPLRRKFLHGNRSSKHSIQERRIAVLDFVAAALFKDRETGIELAARIAAQNPHRQVLSATSQAAVSGKKGTHK
jgi:TetR/AcrR family transcriptional regulator